MATRKRPERNERIQEWEAKALYLVMGLMLVATAYFTVKNTAAYVNSGQVKEKQYKWCVVIDAGHGGADPGKVGINGALEKDVNLQIALRLKAFLEAADVKVVLTREDDKGLYGEAAGSKKVQDMKKRIEIIEAAEPDLIVSIHQNSYHEEYVKGAQVFYYTGSETGKRTAEILQRSMIERVDAENHREAKANDSYYLLKKTSRPIVIVECGFLSNSGEAAMLVEKEYQERLAWAVYMGMMQSLNAQS